MTEYQAFWSYTHEDDQRLRGYVTRLSERIRDEYAVSSGDDLEVFLDRNSLAWGEMWRTKINDALGSAPFLIAVVTPKFVKSQECRRELLTFVAESKSRGFSRLLLPILLIDVPGLSEDSEDEVLALLARTQYVNWTRLRLKSEEDPEVLAAVNGLALRIMELQAEVERDLQAVEQREDQDGQEAIDDILLEINSRLPEWLEAVDFDPVARAQWNAMWSTRADQAIRIFNQRRGISGQFLSVWAKLGNELAPLSAKRLAESKIYHRLTIELDPFITAAFRLVELEPQFFDLLGQVQDGIRDAMRAIEGRDPERTWIFDPEPTKYSSSLKRSVADLNASQQFVVEANGIVEQWSHRLTELEARVSAERSLVQLPSEPSKE